MLSRLLAASWTRTDKFFSLCLNLCASYLFRVMPPLAIVTDNKRLRKGRRPPTRSLSLRGVIWCTKPCLTAKTLLKESNKVISVIFIIHNAGTHAHVVAIANNLTGCGLRTFVHEWMNQLRRQAQADDWRKKLSIAWIVWIIEESCSTIVYPVAASHCSALGFNP